MGFARELTGPGGGGGSYGDEVGGGGGVGEVATGVGVDGGEGRVGEEVLEDV